MQYTTNYFSYLDNTLLCYQDFKDTFVCNTQLVGLRHSPPIGCVIRISKILLYAIHNYTTSFSITLSVVLSGFQRYFCMQYTTLRSHSHHQGRLCYQDFKDTFVCNTQRVKVPFAVNVSCVIRISKILLYAIHNIAYNKITIQIVVLSGFQRYFCMQYTTYYQDACTKTLLCYQDFKDTFVCNTQQRTCYLHTQQVVLSGFQRYFCMQYTTYSN